MMANTEHVSESIAKIQRLNAVFKKAIDVASNSLNNADLDECFQDLKSQYGNVLPKLFMNMIAKSQVNIEASYKDICILRDLEESMRALDAPIADNVSSSSSALLEEMEICESDDPLPPTILRDLKRLEAERLREAIEQLKSEIKTSNAVAVKLRNNMNAEIAAVGEEREKLGNISDVHT